MDFKRLLARQPARKGLHMAKQCGSMHVPLDVLIY